MNEKRYFSFSIGIFAVIVIAVPAHAFEDELTRLKASGAPMSIADLQPSQLDNEENSYRFLKRAMKGVIELDTQLNEAFVFGQPATKAFIEKFQSQSSMFPDTFELLSRAASSSTYVPDHDFELEPRKFLTQTLEQNQKLRSVARVLMYRSNVLLAQGKADEAAGTALEIVKIGRQSFGNYGLANNLVSIAVTGMGLHQLNLVLQLSELELETHKQIATELAALNPLTLFQESLVAERAIGIDFLKQQGVLSAAVRFTEYLATMRRVIDNSDKPVFQNADLFAVIPADPLVSMIVPAIEQGRTASMRILAQKRALEIVNALNCQMADEPYLDNLELQGDSKIDPYSGKPMVVKRSEKGWTVYSIGWNKKDDQGTFDHMLDFGFGPDQ